MNIAPFQIFSILVIEHNTETIILKVSFLREDIFSFRILSFLINTAGQKNIFNSSVLWNIDF